MKIREFFKIEWIAVFMIGLGLNAYHVLSNVPPDGRWVFQLPLTSLFIIAYFIALRIAATNGIEKFLLIYSLANSLLFLFFARTIQFMFQDVDFAYIRYVSIAPYVVIYGAGLVVAYLLKNKRSAQSI